MRGLEILKEENLNVKVVLMPDGEDPDDVVRKRGAAAYQNCLDNALPLVDYKLHSLERKYDLTRAEDKRAYAQAAMPVVREAASAAEQEALLKIVRDKTGFTYQSLSRDLEETLPERRAAAPVSLPRGAREKGDKVHKARRFLLGAVLFGLPYAARYALDEADFPDEVHRAVVRYISFCRETDQPVRVTDLFEIFGENTPEFNAILDLNTEERLFGVGAERYFKDCERTLARWRIQEKMTALNERLNAETDVTVRRRLAEELTALTGERKNYQTYR